MKKSRLWMIGILLLFCSLFAVSIAWAGCTTCVFTPLGAWCTGGNIATLCRANDEGCTFSGSWECDDDGGCFLAGTSVLTNKGLLPIEALGVGDQVLSLAENGSAKWTLVERTYKALRLGYYVINENLRVTGDHPFYIDQRWTTAAELSVGDFLVNSSGDEVKIASLEWVESGVRVFNIDVLAPDTFYAGGYLVHNKDAKSTKADEEKEG